MNGMSGAVAIKRIGDPLECVLCGRFDMMAPILSFGKVKAQQDLGFEAYIKGLLGKRGHK